MYDPQSDRPAEQTSALTTSNRTLRNTRAEGNLATAATQR